MIGVYFESTKIEIKNIYAKPIFNRAFEEGFGICFKIEILFDFGCVSISSIPARMHRTSLVPVLLLVIILVDSKRIDRIHAEFRLLLL